MIRVGGGRGRGNAGNLLVGVAVDPFPPLRHVPCCEQMGKVHGSLARAGKVRGQTPKVAKGEKKKETGRAKKRLQYNRRFVNVVVGVGKKRGPNTQCAKPTEPIHGLAGLSLLCTQPLTLLRWYPYTHAILTSLAGRSARWVKQCLLLLSMRASEMHESRFGQALPQTTVTRVGIKGRAGSAVDAPTVWVGIERTLMIDALSPLLRCLSCCNRGTQKSRNT